MAAEKKDDIIHVNGASFRIIENKLQYGDRILSHTFKLGGMIDDCINISIMYENGNPVYGKMPHVQYDEQCSMNPPLSRSTGSVTMIKTLLRYVNKHYPTVTRFEFDDMSHIDCATEEEKIAEKQGKGRKMIKPMNLYYLSIAYNSETWYEKNFGATMINEQQYQKYRERLAFLTRSEEKPDYVRFLEIAQPPQDQFQYLEERYQRTSTYREFFEAISKTDRCRILRPWINTFMEHYLKGVFTNTGWIITITSIDKKNANRRNGGGKQTRKKKTHYYYQPAGKIIHFQEIHRLG